MIKKRYLTLALSAALAFSPLAALKAASLIGLSYGTDSQVELDSNVGAGVSLNNRASTAITGNVLTITRHDLEADTEANGRSDVRVSIPNTGVDNNSNSDNGDNGNVATTTSSNAALHADENAFIHANEQSAIFRAGDVATQEDLRAYALSEIKADENVGSMSFANDNIMVGYKDHGRFIGIVPVLLDVEVKVDQKGDVSFDYPWYSFLIVKDKSGLEAKIRAEIEGMASSSAGWTNYDRAVLASRILAALKAHFGESSTASTTNAI